MRQHTRQVWQYGFGTLAFIAGFLALFFFCWSYAEISVLFPLFDLPVTHYKKGPVFFISESTYQLCRVGYLLAFLLAAGGVYFFRPEGKASFSQFFPVQTCRFFISKFRKVWREMSGFEKRFLLFTSVFLLAARLVIMYRLPFRIDEITTYELFVQRGLAGSLLFYPVPNNHVLFSLLCLPFRWFLSNPFYLVKLPSLVISTISFPVIYVALRSCFNFPVTYVGWAGYSFSYFAVTYAVNGRGYSLLAVWVALILIAELKILQGKEPYYWLVYILSAAAGFYTIPIFVYPFVPVLLTLSFGLLAKRDAERFGQLVAATGFAGIGTVLLYSPVLIVSGLALLIGNEYVLEVPDPNYYAKLFGYIKNRQSVVIGQERAGFYLWFFCVAVLSGLLVFRNRFQDLFAYTSISARTVLIFLVLTVLPWVSMALQKVAPQHRIWTFKAVFDFLVIAFCAQLLASLFFRNNPKLQLALLLAGITLYNIYEVIKLYRGLMYW